MNNMLKDTIHIDWLDLDPDQLAAEVPVEMISRPRPRPESDGGGIEIVKVPYVSWQAVEADNERAYQAFAGYKGSHTTDLVGYAYEWIGRNFSMLCARRGRSLPIGTGKCHATAWSITVRSERMQV